MNVDKLVDEIIINKSRILSYDEKIEIIQDIIDRQSKLPLIVGKITAVGLQTLADDDLITVLQDTYILIAINFFLETNKKNNNEEIKPNKKHSFFDYLKNKLLL